MAIINVDDAYILNETGAQVDKTTGIPFKNESLTEAEAAQARANIRAGGSNDNLLDNAYFVGGGSQLGDGVFPINQRGQASYSVGATPNAIDRWYGINSVGTYTLQSDELVVSSSGFAVLGQKIFNPIPAGTYTLSIKMGSIGASQLALYVDFADSGVSDFRTSAAAGEIVTSTFTATAPITFVRFFTDSGNSFSVQAAKLETGTVSTLANDAPPDFGEELRKCQRYLWVEKFPANTIIGSGITFNTNTIYDIVTPVAMRTGGTLTMTVSTSLYVVYNAVYALAGVVNGITSHGNHLRVSMNNNGGSDYGTLNHADLLVSYETVVTVSNEP